MIDDTLWRQYGKGGALAAVGHPRLAGWPPREAARPLRMDGVAQDSSPDCPEVTE